MKFLRSSPARTTKKKKSDRTIDDVVKTFNAEQKKAFEYVVGMALSTATAASEIKNVVFNDPATIVIWGDGSKTVVKCGDGDIYDPEKGLAMAIAKKALGNEGNYYNVFRKWIPEKKAPSYRTGRYPWGHGEEKEEIATVSYDMALDAAWEGKI